MSDQAVETPEGEGTNPAISDPNFGLEQPQDKAAMARAPKAPVLVGQRGIQIENLAQLAEFSRLVHGSGLAPKSFKTPQAIAIAVQKGMEAGLTPLNALSSVYVVNGLPSWTGKGALGLVFSSRLMVQGSYRAWIEGEGDKMVAWCESTRIGHNLVRTPFSVDDAKIAKLWQKRGRDNSDTPWITYPKRMLLWKAISHHLNLVYPDVLGGWPIAEDAIDTEAYVNSDAPRKSLLGSVEGTGEEDPLLAAGLKAAPQTAPAATIIDEASGVNPEILKAVDRIDLNDPKHVVTVVGAPTGNEPPAARPVSESVFANLLAAMDESEDFADLERKTQKALTAAGDNRKREKRVKDAAAKLLKKFPPPSENARG